MASYNKNPIMVSQ